MMEIKFEVGAIYTTIKPGPIRGIGITVADGKNEKDEYVILRWITHSNPSEVGRCRCLRYSSFCKYFKEYEFRED